MKKNQSNQQKWFEQAANGRSIRSVAEALDMSSGNLSRWLKEGRLSAEKLIAVAIELDADPVQALVDNAVLPEVSAPRESNAEELVARIERLLALLKKEIAQEEAEIISLNSKRNQPQSDTMFENMVADSSPDEDEQRHGDEIDH